MLLRILLILLLLLVLPHLFLLWRFRKHLSVRQMLFLSIPNLLLLAFCLPLSFFETYSPTNARITGEFLVFFIGWTGAEILLALFCLAGFSFHKISALDKIFTGLGFTFALLLLSVVAYGHFQGMGRLKIVHEDLYFEDLPNNFDGYRLAVFSDFHLGTYGSDIRIPRKVTDSILAQRPQAVLFLGDLVNYHVNETQTALTELQRLNAPDGVFSVMGNHDYQMHLKWEESEARQESIRRLQEVERAAGWKLLCNEHEILCRNGDTLAIVGVENDGKPPFPELGDLRASLNGLPDTLGNGKPLFKILLSHDPTHWRRKVLPQTDIQLTLSGHTHATQFQIGSFSPAKWFYREWGGLYREGERQLYVSRGIGGAMLPFRFGAWPEINVITLHKKGK